MSSGEQRGEGKTFTPGQRVYYRFEAQPNQALFFDVENTSDTVDFTLLAPDGRSELFNSYRDHGPVELEQAGVYTLYADPRGDKVATFAVSLYNIDPPVIDAGELAFDAYNTQETRYPGQLVRYAVALTAEDTIFLDVSKTSSTVDFTLTTPDGRTQVLNSYRDFGPVTVTESGAYELLADPRNDATVEYEFIVWRVNPAIVDGGRAKFSEYIAQSTQMPGQIVRYEFDATSGQTVFFDVTRASNTTDFTLTAPDGRTEMFNSYRDSGPLSLQQSGVYQLIADPRGDQTSDYEFALWDVVPTVIDGGTVQADTFINGATKIPGQMVEYSFSGEAGQRLSFETDKVSATTDFSLLAPDGRTEVFKHYRKADPVELPQTGQYRLLADPRGDHTSSYEFIIRTESQAE